ncbi:penicillin-binding protein [Patescibacteria group bacterium]
MPIPPLNKNISGGQSWRRNKKKYYINREKSVPKQKKNKSKRGGRLSGRKKLFSPKLKRRFWWGVIGIVVIGILSVFILFVRLTGQLPNPDGLINRELAQSTKILDRTGETVLYEIHGNEKRTLINLDEIPDYVKWATIAIEDKDFYKHRGISLWGILRGVVWQKIRGRVAQGGSTLTQQFVKNSILTPERTIKRKIKEWVLSYRIEKKYTKDEILQMYLNEIPYGSTAYGVEAASQRYFGKSVREINLPEAAVLAALPQAPSKYSPYGPNKDLLTGRQKYIIDLLFEQGYISEAKAEAAKQTEIEFKPPAEKIIAPHFVMYVKEMLSEKYGEKMVEQGGLKIYTTLDLYKQKIAEEVIEEVAEKNKEEYKATNAALISIDPKTGQILAMVGSKDYYNDEIDGQVNITTSLRQPGSSLKPLVYAAAFLKGYTPNTVLYDVVTNFSHDKAEPYEPHNYDDQEHGPVTIRKALAGSLNIPAVKTIYLADIENVLDLAQELGYTSLGERDRFGLSLVLGGGEVKLIEHANAYSAFAREGLIHPLAVLLKVEDAGGNILEEFKLEEKRVLEPRITRLINDVLSDNAARSYAFGERNWLTLGGRPVAAKTGTTNDYRDAWTIGYTPSIVTGVWVGNNDNSEMKRGAAGGVVAAPIWHDYMQKVLGDTPIEHFKKTEIPRAGKPVLDGEITSGKTIKIDKTTGLLATEFTPIELIEEQTFFEPHSILYYLNKNDPLGDAPKNPEHDPQFSLWEEAIQAWFEEEQGSATSTFATSAPPTEFDNIHTEENKPLLEVVTPGNNQIIDQSPLVVRLKTSAPRGVKRAEYYIDNNLFFTNLSYPFNLEKRIDFLNNGFHNLKIKVCDDVSNCTSRELEFNLNLSNSGQSQNISVSLLSPTSGLAVSNIDFPLIIKVNLTDPEPISTLNVYYLIENNPIPNQITSIQPVDTNQVTTHWINIPPSGTYKIYAETISWNNVVAKSKQAIINVNNINKPDESTEENNSQEN